MNFFEICRQNTGRHFLDSGGAYGRHWEQPPIPPEAPLVKEWREGCPATLSTAVLLDRWYGIDAGLQESWGNWLETADGEAPWAELVEEFMACRGCRQECRDNVYNGENDLDQVFIFTVFESDTDDPVIVLQVHTGCDVRGGYADPVFCRSGEGLLPPVSAGYEAVEGWGAPEDGVRKALSKEELQALDEGWQQGWSSYPYGELDKDVERWFEFTRSRDAVCVLLATGEIAKVRAGLWLPDC